MPVLSEIRFIADSGSVRKARCLIANFLERLVPPEALEAAVLLTSELATLSASGAASQFAVSACLAAAWLRVSLSDDDCRFPGLEAENSTDLPDGLLIVHSLATEWGIEQTVSSRSMWFELDLLSPDLYTYMA